MNERTEHLSAFPPCDLPVHEDEQRIDNDCADHCK